MADLIARGQEPGQHWRRTLPVGQRIEIGRAATWSVPWDPHVSRLHAEISWDGRALTVSKQPTARNPIVLDGVSNERIQVGADQPFVIGRTTFQVADEQVVIPPERKDLIDLRTYEQDDLRRVRYRDAQARLEVLSRIPTLIAGSANDAELFIRLGDLLLEAIVDADIVAIVAAPEPPHVQVLHWDRRPGTSGDFRPSARLIHEAARRGRSVAHVWRGSGDDHTREIGGQGSSDLDFTLSANIDWAYAVPVRGAAEGSRILYVAGRSGHGPAGIRSPDDPWNLGDEVKFTELVASILGALLQVRTLQRREATLGQFFSPVVLHSLLDSDSEAFLKPRPTDVAVLFCDLRGFSRESERSSTDLIGLLERVSEAMGQMTQRILEQGGVIGDYQGDSAMGFWGWPLPQPDAVTRACRAALAIRREFNEHAAQSDHPLSGFRIGIGVASGPAIAGRIGTPELGKVSVFGPVVNLASRLEGMTKLLQTEILLDEATAAVARASLPWDVARIRTVARVRPYGLETPLTVSELLPPASELPELADEHIRAYEEAVDAFLASDWATAYKRLNRVPAEDQVKDFLTEFIILHQRKAPPDWDGVIPLTHKN